MMGTNCRQAKIATDNEHAMDMHESPPMFQGCVSDFRTATRQRKGVTRNQTQQQQITKHHTNRHAH